MRNAMQFLQTPAGQVVLIGATVVVVGYLFRRGAKVAAQAIDPTSEENIFYKGVNAVGEVISGKPDFDLGFWIYDVFNKGAGDV